ncbi:MAG TPA: outer membrane lipoprotein-sorting protein [Thermoanaerobaculia bacterium]|jgi:outer membrane lipoprotein-sorting protein|nr:outer membrane lipoprotein-sorting protein [Thermoanaerobaculia bacterium]
MIRKTFACLLVAGLAGAAVQAQTADELIEKNLQATGGRQKIEAVKSIRMTGKMVAPQGMEIPMTMEFKEPGKLRSEATFQGMTMIQAFDGKDGWSINPMLGKKDPEKMSADDVKQAEEQLDSFNLFTKYKEKGHTIEYVGKEDLEGTPAYKLKLTRKNGDVSYIYLDAESYLMVKMNGKTKIQGQELESDTTVGDYKAVDGVLYPHSIESQLKGMPGKMTITFSKIEVNPTLDDSRFAMPAVEKPAMEKKETPKPPKQ